MFGVAIDCNFIDCNTIVGGSKSVHCYTMIDCKKLMDGSTTIDCCRKIKCKKFLDGNKSLVGNNDGKCFNSTFFLHSNSCKEILVQN